MKKSLAVLCAMMLLVSVFAGASAATKLKFDLPCSMDHPWGVAATHFTELIEKATDGRITTDLYPSYTSGTEAESLAGMQTGTTDMTMTGGQFVTYSPYASLLEAPYAFDSEEDVIAMMDSEVGQAIRDAYESLGFHCLWYQLRGPRELTSNTPIMKASDMQGLKMRMSGNPLHNDMWVATGAVTSTMSLTECFTALSQHVVDAQENPLDLIYDYSLSEVQSYVNCTNHVYSAIMVVISEDTYNDLSDEDRAALDTVAAEMQTYVNEYYNEYRNEYRGKLEEAGMKFNDDVDIESFKAAMVPVVEQYMESQGLLDLYRKTCEISAAN